MSVKQKFLIALVVLGTIGSTIRAEDEEKNPLPKTELQILATFKVDPKFLDKEFLKKNSLTVVKAEDGTIQVVSTPHEVPAEADRLSGTLNKDGTRTNSQYAPGTRLCQVFEYWNQGWNLTEQQAFQDCWNSLIGTRGKTGRFYTEGSVEYHGRRNNRETYACYGVYPCGN